jgi:hypothetical protein
MHCYQGEHIWCWYGPGHWFLTSQLRYHHNHGGPCGHGYPATLASRHGRHHRCGDRAELASHVRFGDGARWLHQHSSVGEHGCARQTGGGELTGSHHRSGQPASTTAGGLLHLTITL